MLSCLTGNLETDVRMTDSSPRPSSFIVDFHCASLSSILPVSPLSFLSLLSSPTGRGRCSPTLSLVLRCLPVKREFFLATVAHVGMLGLFKVKT